MDRATATLRVEGMTCGACVEVITSAGPQLSSDKTNIH